MDKAQVGSGKETSFGKISGAKEVKTDDSDGIRDGITKRVTATPCGTPDFGPGLAGGSADRFDQLKHHSFADAGQGEPFDSDYTIVRRHKRKLREPDSSKGEGKNRD